MQTGLWDKARQGDEKAVARVLDIMERRARLAGLEDRTPEGFDPEQLTINVVPYQAEDRARESAPTATGVANNPPGSEPTR
jgi:hypothetical protein